MTETNQAHEMSDQYEASHGAQKAVYRRALSDSCKQIQLMENSSEQSLTHLRQLLDQTTCALKAAYSREEDE